MNRYHKDNAINPAHVAKVPLFRPQLAPDLVTKP
jgi:hypothetical protein